jgi:hypothetical protein
MALSDDLVLDMQKTQSRILETQAEQGKSLAEQGKSLAIQGEAIKGLKSSMDVIDSRVLELHQVVVAGGENRRSFASRLDELELKDRAYHGSLKPAPPPPPPTAAPTAQWKIALKAAAIIISGFMAGLAVSQLHF